MRVGEKLKGFAIDAKKYWKVPRQGEFLTNKQFVYFCLSGMVISLFGAAGPGMIGFGAGNFFIGSYMQIKAADFVTIGIIGMVMSYITLGLQPFNMLIYENHGRLEPRKRNAMHIFNCVRICVGVGCYFIPAPPFQGILQGLPYIIGNIFLINAVNDYITWFIRYKFSAKYGRVKPLVIACALPAVLIMSVVPWLPIREAEYAVRIGILHALCSFGGFFGSNFGNYSGMNNLLTQNSQERQRIISYTPILHGLFATIVSALFPLLINITLFGRALTGWEDVWVYRLICPVFGALSIFGVLFLIPVKENLIEQHVNRPKVKFLKGAKQVLKNKYWWITNTSGTLGAITAMFGNILTWYLIYQLRLPTLTGIVTQATILGFTLGHILVPPLIKRFDKKRVFMIARLISAGLFAVQFPLFLLGEVGYWMIVPIVLINNILGSVHGDIQASFGGDILDYHQWKTGERADSICGLFTYIFSPLNTVIGLIAPAIYLIAGWTNDWGVLYNTDIFNDLFSYCFYIAAIGVGLSIIPFLFYDLTTKKHKQCVDELRERTRTADIAEIERHKAEGRIAEIDSALLEKYGYDIDGNKIEEPEAEPSEEPVVEAGEQPVEEPSEEPVETSAEENDGGDDNEKA